MNLLLITLVVGFVGGLLGSALGPLKAFRRVLLFVVLVFACACLLHIAQAIRMLHSGLPTLTLDTLVALGSIQGALLLTACFATGFGWVCASVVRGLFEE